MMRIKKILYTTDFSECSDCVLPHAVYLVNKYNAELHILHAIVLHADNPHKPEYHFPDIDELLLLLKKNASKMMSSELINNDIKNVKVKKIQKRGISPAQVILEYCLKNEIDLIVMGTHGRRGIRHLFLGSVTEEVVRLAECPVLTIRESTNLKPAASIKNILVPVDFSDHSKTALEHALKIAPVYNARLQLLHVIEESIHPSFYAAGIKSVFEVDSQLLMKSKLAVKQMLNSIGGSDNKADICVTEGRPYSEIIKFAEQNLSDLIIIATHGLTGIEHLLLGSESEKVVRMSTCPVLTVKSFGKSLI